MRHLVSMLVADLETGRAGCGPLCSTDWRSHSRSC